MTNNIKLRIEQLQNVLDEVYKRNAVTSALDYNGPLLRAGAKADEVQIAKRTLQGLGDYSRTPNGNGYPTGSVKLEWETHKFTQDRARAFEVDRQDNDESGETAFSSIASLGGQFEREFVVPEIDAYRFSLMASSNGILKADAATLNADTVKQAIDDAIAAQDDEEVPDENRILYLSSACYNFMKNSKLISLNRDVDKNNGTINTLFYEYDNIPVIKVPKGRFYTSIDLYDGVTAGEEEGGYVKSEGAAEINFLLVHKGAVAGLTKQAEGRYFAPQYIANALGVPVYQKADAHCYQYRRYHDLFIWDNKLKGIYLHAKPVQA